MATKRKQDASRCIVCGGWLGFHPLRTKAGSICGRVDQQHARYLVSRRMDRSYLRIAKRREGRVLLFFILIIVIMWALWVIVISAKGALPFIAIVGVANVIGGWYLWMEWRTITLARRMDREVKDVELDRSIATLTARAGAPSLEAMDPMSGLLSEEVQQEEAEGLAYRTEMAPTSAELGRRPAAMEAVTPGAPKRIFAPGEWDELPVEVTAGAPMAAPPPPPVEGEAGWVPPPPPAPSPFAPVPSPPPIAAPPPVAEELPEDGVVRRATPAPPAPTRTALRPSPPSARARPSIQPPPSPPPPPPPAPPPAPPVYQPPTPPPRPAYQPPPPPQPTAPQQAYYAQQAYQQPPSTYQQPQQAYQPQPPPARPPQPAYQPPAPQPAAYQQRPAPQPPVYQQPAYQQPAYQQPAYQQSAYQQQPQQPPQQRRGQPQPQAEEPVVDWQEF